MVNNENSSEKKNKKGQGCNLQTSIGLSIYGYMELDRMCCTFGSEKNRNGVATISNEKQISTQQFSLSNKNEKTFLTFVQNQGVKFKI